MNTPGERLEYFVNLVYTKKKDFASDLGITYQQVSRYIGSGERSLFGRNYLSKLENLGLDTTWYLTGKGNMFSDSDKGLELNMKLGERKYIPELSPDFDSVIYEKGVKYIAIPDLRNLTPYKMKELFDFLNKETTKLSEILSPLYPEIAEKDEKKKSS